MKEEQACGKETGNEERGGGGGGSPWREGKEERKGSRNGDRG